MNKISINPERTYTKSMYSKVYSISRPTIDKYIKEGRIKTLNIKGAILILA